MQNREVALSPQDVQSKIIIKIYEKFINNEQNEQRKQLLKATLQKFKKTGLIGIIKQYDINAYNKYLQFYREIYNYNKVFNLTCSLPQFQKYSSNTFIDFLINIQDKIKGQKFKSQYFVQLGAGKKIFGWDNDFIKRLSDQAEKNRNQRKTDLQKTNNQQPNINSQSILNSQTSYTNHENSQMKKNIALQSQSSDKKLSQPQHFTTPVNTQNIQKINLPQKQDQKSNISIQKPQQKIKQLKGNKQLSLQKGESSIQKIQKVKNKKIKLDQISNVNEQGQKKLNKLLPKQKQKIREQDQSVSLSEQHIRQNKKRQSMKEIIIEQPEKIRQPKDRVKALKQYLLKRRQFGNLNQNKLRQISEFLNQKLQAFMKYHLANLLEIAKLNHIKVNKMPQVGNQFSYFSKQGCNLKIPQYLSINQDQTKVMKVSYKSKMQIYSILRVKQNVIENNLLKKYENKKQDDKRSDKKLWQYLSRPNPNQNCEICYYQEISSNRITIGPSHIRYLLKNHPYMKKSYLMMSSYI